MSVHSLFRRQFRSGYILDNGCQKGKLAITAARPRTKSSSVRKYGTALSALAAVSVLGAFGKVAYSGQYQPIGADLTTPLVPGQPLGVTVQLNGSSAPITIYSDPPGAVSYQGTINSGDTVQAATDSDLDTDDVAVYVITDGETVVAAEAPVSGAPFEGS